MEEVWKDVPGYEGLYQVSNLGRVKSLDRLIPCKGGKTKIICKGRIKSFCLNKSYYSVQLCKNAKEHKQHFVHRLVALAFIPNPNNYPEIDHIDGNPENNRVENLRWVTRQQNELNPITRKRISDSISGNKHWHFGKYGEESPKSKSIKRIDAGGKEKIYSSILLAAKDNNICVSAISNNIHGRSRTAGGYIWKELR